MAILAQAPTTPLGGQTNTPRPGDGSTTNTTALAQGEAPPLGNTGIKHNGRSTAPLRSQSEQVSVDRQLVMRQVTLDDDLRGCHFWPRSTEVGVVYSGDGVKGSFSGLQNTKSRWGSPLAARPIQHQRKIELGLGIKAWMKLGQPILFLVNTVPHHGGLSAGEVLQGLQGGITAMQDGPKWAEDKKRFGIAGYHSDYEHTWGRKTGHHPHKNTVMFLDRELSETELEALQSSLFGRYAQGVVNAGLAAPHHKYGLNIQQVTTWGEDAATVAGYVAKGGMGVAAEVKGSATKSAGGDRFTPGEMLDLLGEQKAETGSFDPVTLWAYRDYEKTFKGLRSSWSRGMKKRLGIDFIAEESFTEMEGELFKLAGVEVVERPERKARVVVAGVVRDEWKKIRYDFHARGLVEQSCDASSAVIAQRNVGLVLERFGVEYREMMVSLEEFDFGSMRSHEEVVAGDLRKHLLADRPMVPIV